MIPLLTVASMLLMFFCSSTETKVQTAYLFLSVGLIFINIFVIELLQGILEKEELFRESALAGQKKESQLAHYRDMQTVYERQGRKLHDYKNQIRTMQVLLKAGCRCACGTADGEHFGGDGGGQYEPPGGGCSSEPEIPRRKGAGRVHDVPGERHGRAAA